MGGFGVLLAFFVIGEAIQITSTGQWTSATRDVLLCTGFPGYRNGFRFSGVSVPRGAQIQGAILVVNFVQAPAIKPQYTIENADNSAPLTDCTQLGNRSVTDWATSSSPTPAGRTEYIVTPQVTKVVNRTGWNYENAMTAFVSFSFFAPGSLAADAELRINYTFTSSVSLSLSQLLPLTGNWSSGLNIASTNANFSVGLNVSFLPPFLVPVSVGLTGSISNGAVTLNCLNHSTVLTSLDFSKQFVCQFPCAPRQGHRLTLQYCWSVPATEVLGNLTMSHQLVGTGCSSDLVNGTINFPDPVFLSGTLMPNDGRPYLPGGGQLTSNATSQPLSNRDLFNAIVGVQHFCPGSWVTVWLESNLTQRPCTLLQGGSAVAPPPDAAEDYTTMQFTVPACDQAVCPGQNPMYLKMTYSGLGLATADNLLYPTLPVIVAVSGCVDVYPATTQCPTRGGTRISITMQQPVGYSGVSVLVISSCTSVITNFTVIYCTLPSGVGTAQPLFVFSAGLVSAPVHFVSYSPPSITSLTGGVGCVPDPDAQGGAVAVKMCDRNGSSTVLMTMIGDNFGDMDIPPLLTLQGLGSIPVSKSPTSPHTTLYFALPAGFGQGLPLRLVVGSQSAVANVSYEPCPPGQDATCTPCAVGRYGVTPPACVSCPVGRSQPFTGQSECVLCAKGTYQQASGQQHCVRCPDKMTSLGVGSDDSQACSSCPVTHFLAFEGANHVCAPCAPNSMPDFDSCGCMSGFFDDRLNITGDGSSLNCRVCPPGANCRETGTRSASMGPLPGWWKSELGSFIQCLDAANCLGVQWGSALTINSSSMCLEHRGGVLCAECDVGYQPSSLKGGACVPCDNSALAWLWVSLVAVLVVIGLLGIGFCVHQRRQTRKARENERKTESQQSHSISSTSVTTPSEWSNTLTRSSRAETVALPAPVMKKKRDANTLISTGKIAVGFLQILSSMVALNVALPSTFMQVMRVFAFLNFDFMPWASIRCVFHINFYTRIYIGCLYPFIIVLLLIVCVAIPIALRNKRDYQDEGLFREHRSQYVNKAITLVLFCIFLLYPWITLQLLQFGICLPLDGKYYLIADMTQLCFEGEWLDHLGSVIALFLLLSIGIPVVLGTLLYRSRFDLRSTKVRERLGFLYLAYSSECWWFEVVEMSARVVLISIVRFFDPKLQAPLRMGVCFVYIVVVLLATPYVHESLDTLSLFCMTELLLVSCLAHLLPAVGQWQGTYIDDLLSAVLLCVAFVLLLFFLLQMVRASRWLVYHPWVRDLLRKAPATRLRVATRFAAMLEAELAESSVDISVSSKPAFSPAPKDSSTTKETSSTLVVDTDPSIDPSIGTDSTNKPQKPKRSQSTKNEINSHTLA